MNKPTTPDQARSAVDACTTQHALTVDLKSSGVIDPAVVCWRCEESIGLEAPLSAVRAFIRQHARCAEEHYTDDDTQDTSGVW